MTDTSSRPFAVTVGTNAIGLELCEEFLASATIAA